jgi:linoleoyl-CoA desaturase
MSKLVKFIDPNNSSFYTTVRQRVDTYFAQKQISKKANGEMFFKTYLFLGVAFLLVTGILSGYFSVWVMFGMAAVLGAFKAFIGFNVGHDGIHGSYSENAYVNYWIGLSFNIIGANSDVWRVTHNIVHHTYTNIPGHDEDIAVAPGLIRLQPEDKLNFWMRYQHIYAFFLYGFTSLMWVFRKDYVKFFQKRIGFYDNSKHTTLEYFNLFFFKFLYYFIFIFLPLFLLPITWWQFLIGFVVMHFVESLVLGLVFQMAHVVEGVDYPMPNDQGDIENAWAIHQLQTTANFAPKSFWARFLCGGLNFQIEHHLFPKVCHVHYPAISGIVKETAQEYGLSYHCNTTFFSALQSHYRMLRRLGREAWQAQYAEGKEIT